MMIYTFIFSPVPVMGQHFTLGAGPAQIMGQNVLPRLYGCRRLWWRLNQVWHKMLYSCTHMATVGVKGLNWFTLIVGLTKSYRVGRRRVVTGNGGRGLTRPVTVIF